MLQSLFRMHSQASGLATLLACVCTLGGVGLSESPPSARQTDTVRAILAAEPAVVNIEGNKPSGKVTAGEPQQVNGMGSGVIVDSRGYILTNQHVVQDVKRIEVTLHDGSKHVGRLIDHDPSTDLAMIKIDVSRPVPVIHFGTSSDLMRGEKVVAIGNPFGYQHTVTEGIISALHRNIPVNGVQEYEDLIQTDASINPGNSGGPLVNIDGAMIGLNAAVRVGAQGIGFAIPVDKALDVAANLISAHRKHAAELPFEVRTSAKNGQPKVYVHRVRKNDHDGIELIDGDCIKSINNRVVNNRLEFELCMLEQSANSEIEIEYERDGKSKKNRLTTGSSSSVSLVSARNGESQLPRNGESAATTASGLAQSTQAWNVLGLRLKPADAQQISQIDPSYSGGFTIVAIREHSPAHLAQLRTGDILVGLMDWQVPNWNDLNWIFSSTELKSTNKPKFRIIRGKGVYYGTLELNRQVAR